MKELRIDRRSGCQPHLHTRRPRTSTSWHRLRTRCPPRPSSTRNNSACSRSPSHPSLPTCLCATDTPRRPQSRSRRGPSAHPSRHATNGWDRRRLSTSSPRRARSESYSSAPPSISTSSFSTPSLGTLDFETPLIPASASTQTPMYTTLLEDIKSPAAASPS